jgi:hypothetical protein
MTTIQAYLLAAPLVILAMAGAAVWFSRPKHKHHRLHPGE